MAKYNTLHQEDEKRQEREIEEFFENGRNALQREQPRDVPNQYRSRVIYLENNAPNKNILELTNYIAIQNDNQNHENDEQMDPEMMPEGFYDLLPLNPDDKDNQDLEDEIKAEYKRKGIEYKDFKDDYSEIYADKDC